MDDNEDFDIDPALAAAMGFSGFGSQATKKRKYDTNDGFVDPDLGKAAAATGANSIPTRERQIVEPGAGAVSAEVGKKSKDQGGSLAASATGAGGAAPSLEALRHGVRNERGDVAYFLPSFIENPWANLKPQ